MPTKTPIIAPSILSANFSRVADAVDLIEHAGGDWVHLDVMDGQFVPNLTFGPKLVKDIRSYTRKTFDVHLMTQTPERLIAAFADAGADQLTFHLEAGVHAHRTIQAIREAGMHPGISIVPSTPADSLSELLEEVDLILIMTVNPGFGGQKLIPRCLHKIRRLDEQRMRNGHSYRISVDGGINAETAPAVLEAGADVLVTGSAFFGAEDPGVFVSTLRNH